MSKSKSNVLKLHTAIMANDEAARVFVATTYEGVQSLVADWCREWWICTNLGPDLVPELNADCISRYFEHVVGEHVRFEEQLLRLPEYTSRDNPIMIVSIDT